ncbi:Reverse transcriptase [Phytophthora palmivora]|uniref:Reverse transcriptase n=1 Tax=Phytophthora palmivora TaxID=4796 RepID=A0A2P4YA56_9STRA|nr:Reverse transcriptase [Phytophthora palmivora]
MPFGLENAPLVYQAMLDNCLWGFVRLSPEEEAEVDADVLEFLQLKPQDSENQSSEKQALKSEMSALTSQMTVFQRNIPVPTYMGPVLGRTNSGSYRSRTSPTKSEGLRATPKIVKGVEDLPFPSTLKGVQSFMGSLNYYNKFIEDFTLYELTDEQIRSGRDLTCAK